MVDRPSLFNDGLNPLDIITGCWALRQSHCLFLYHLFIIFTHTPVCLTPTSDAGMRLLVCEDPSRSSYLTDIKLQQPHPRIRHTRPLKSLHAALIFSTSFLLCFYKTWSSTKPPKRSATVPLPLEFTLHHFPFIFFTAVILNPHQVSNFGPTFAPPHGGFHHN